LLEHKQSNVDERLAVVEAIAGSHNVLAVSLDVPCHAEARTEVLVVVMGQAACIRLLICLRYR
jgi:hypothetical protein